MAGFFSYVKQTALAVGEEIKQQAATMQEEGLGIRYITRRIIAAPFPFDDNVKVGGATVALPVSQQQAAGVTLNQLAAFLHKHHPDHFMMWNLSEKSFDYTKLDQQVIEFKFPGYPSPPLNQVFALCNSMHAWLSADEKNVAVVACATGHGRTLCAVAWYLAWSGQLPTAAQAVAHCIRRLGIPPEIALIPTQQRYMDYLAAMLSGKRPSTAPILLERVILNSIPRLGDRKDGAKAGEEACRPYLQIFRDAKLVYTSTGRDSTELRWYTKSDGSILFPVNLVLEGDILIRVRHLASDQKRVSMLRFGFHTGFVSPGNTRFTKAQLDGAHTDDRFEKNFWLDLIFRTTDTEQTEEEKEQQKRMADYWDQINSARRTTKPGEGGQDLQAPIGRVNLNASASATPAITTSTAAEAAAAAPSSASSSPAPLSSLPDTLTSTKKSLGSLFTSFSTKAHYSLFGTQPDGSQVNPAEEEAALEKLRKADELLLKKAKRKLATEAAVQAALASPLAKSPTSGAAEAARANQRNVNADADSFADLQAYVSGLGALDARSTEVDSDEEEAAQQQGKKDEASLEAAMAGHFEDDDNLPTSPVKVPTATDTQSHQHQQQQQRSDDAMFASLGLQSAPAALDVDSGAPSASASVSTPTRPASTKLDLLSPTSNAALEAELAALQADVGVLNFSTDGDDVVLDDADEAALLASLQDELDA